MSKVLNMVGGGAKGLFASIFATGVAQSDTVTLTTPSGKVKSGKWSSRPNPAAHGLPDAYQEAEYIESTGTQYIKTGILGNYSADLDFMLTAYKFPTGGETLFGSQITNQYMFLTRSWDSPYNQLRYQSWYGNNGNSIKLFGDANLNDRKKVTADFYSSGNDLIYNGELIQSGGVGVNAVENESTNVYIFANNVNGNPDGYSCMRFYPSKMRNKNKNLVRDYIPCYRKSDHVAGAYDLINNTFTENAGTGEFIVGPDVPVSIGGYLFEKLGEFGTYTLTANNSAITVTKDILVDAVAEYQIAIAYS